MDITFTTFILLLAVVHGKEVSLDDVTAVRRNIGDEGLADNINEWASIRLDEELTPKVKFVGERLVMDCFITGKPTPEYKWLKDGRLIDATVDGKWNIKTVEYGSRLRISSLDVHDTGIYTCLGRNLYGERNTSTTVQIKPMPLQMTTPRKLGSDDGDPDDRSRGDLLPGVQNPNSRGDDVVPVPFCQDYKGRYCALLSSHSLYVTSRSGQIEAENDIIGRVEQLIGKNLRPESECFRKSVQAMCYFKMPLCGPPNPQGQPTALRLCRTECQELFHVCRQDFQNDQSGWRVLPDCSQLDDGLGCLRIGLVPTTTVSAKKTDQQSSDEMSNLFINIVLPIALGLVVVLIILVTVICICKKRKANRPHSPVSVCAPSSNTNSSTAKGFDIGSSSEKSASIFIKDVLVDNIHFLQELGMGSFGKVFKGQVFGLYGNGTASFVYIKTLKDKPTAKEHQEFQEEISGMSDVRHQHITLLLGTCLKGAPQCMLYEYLPLGNLAQFLQNQEVNKSCLQVKESMYILTQIASGLEYLSMLRYVHKDIAARNILVSNNLTVKLSALKIIYGLHSADYCGLHGSMIAVRWSPAETITYGHFSPETDVYSYGVLMWEVFSSGQVPYCGYSNEAAIEMIQSRQLLACPPSCPPRIYSLMMECWHETGSKRPTAKEVHQKMRTWYLDNNHPYPLGSTSAPSVSGSSALSQHSSTGPSFPSIQTNTTDLRSGNAQCMSPLPLQQPPFNQLHSVVIKTENPPYYNALYPEKQTLAMEDSLNDLSSSFSESSRDHYDDDESEFSMPIPSVPRAAGNPYSNGSHNRRAKLGTHDSSCSQSKPFLSEDHV